jgi:hypothetical protein
MSSHSEKQTINLWTGILSDCIIGPYALRARVSGCHYRTFPRTHLNGLLEVRVFTCGFNKTVPLRSASIPVRKRATLVKEANLLFLGLHAYLTRILSTFVVYRSEFLATDPEVPGSIPGATTFSEK